MCLNLCWEIVWIDGELIGCVFNYFFGWFFRGIIVLQLVVQGSSPGVRAGHTAVTIGAKASNFTNSRHLRDKYDTRTLAFFK